MWRWLFGGGSATGIECSCGRRLWHLRYDAHGLLRISCSRNPTAIRISRDYHPAFMLMSGRGSRSYAHLRASSCGRRLWHLRYDAHGLLRISCSRNPTHHSHIAGLSSRFYAHVGGGTQGHSFTYEQARVNSDLWSLGIICTVKSTIFPAW